MKESREVRCGSCNKLLMRDGEIKCPRCKEIAVVGEMCEFADSCEHRMERQRYGKIRNMLNTLPIAMRERMRLAHFKGKRAD